MTCREEILGVIDRILQRSNSEVFSLDQLLAEMRRLGTSYKESTIRTHVTSLMCANAPDHHSVAYDDLERVGRGLYKLVR